LSASAAGVVPETRTLTRRPTNSAASAASRLLSRFPSDIRSSSSQIRHIRRLLSLGRTHAIGWHRVLENRCRGIRLSASCLLRSHRKRPHQASPTEKRDELASPHSITSSARVSRAGGNVTPIAFAVVRFTIKSYLVGCSIGISPGFAPFKILSTRSPARRYRSGRFGP